ncbi:unnamed protein product [Moneuplotes crassus]|uniref:Uncharacterized protein n=1 Tax=Euplotes crassus TaxID=5936 RepID=A0AAD1XGL6_EUPCR|nr:unnamed protein product [Moneuplotes crassus]
MEPTQNYQSMFEIPKQSKESTNQRILKFLNMLKEDKPMRVNEIKKYFSGPSVQIYTPKINVTIKTKNKTSKNKIPTERFKCHSIESHRNSLQYNLIGKPRFSITNRLSRRASNDSSVKGTHRYTSKYLTPEKCNKASQAINLSVSNSSLPNKSIFHDNNQD